MQLLMTESYDSAQRESGMIMVYNKDILDENNIPYPAYETDKRMTGGVSGYLPAGYKGGKRFHHMLGHNRGPD